MAERVIKTTIQLDGEKAFKAAIQSVNSEMKVFDSELKLVTAKFGTAEQGMKGLRATAEVLTKKVEAQREKVAALKTAVSDSGEAYKKAKEKYAAAEKKLEETTAAFGENSEEARRAAAELNSTATAVKKAEKAYDNYQIQLNNTQAELIQTTEQLKKTSAEAKSLKNIRLKDLMPPEVAEKVEKVAKAFAKVSTEAGKAAAAAAKIGAKTIITSFKEATKALTAYTTAATAFVTSSVNVGMEFDQAMSKVGAISGATGKNFEALREKAKEMGETTKFSASESAEAMQYMAMAGWKTEEMLSGLPGILDLAAASGESLSTTSDIVTDALTAFGLTAEDSTNFANVLAAASSNANTNVKMMGETFKYVGSVAGSMKYDIEDIAEATGLLANAGLKESQAGTALRSIITRLGTNAGATKTQLGALDILTEELGVEFYDATGKARDFGEVLDEARVAWAGLTDEEATSYAKKIAGQEAIAGWLTLMNASTEDVNKLRTAINSADGAAKEMAEEMQDNLAGSVTIFKSALEGVQIEISDKLSPALKDIVKTGASGLKSIFSNDKGAASKFREQIKSLTTDLVKNIKGMLPDLLAGMNTVILSIGENVPTAVVSLLPDFITGLKNLANGIVDQIPTVAPTILQGGIDLFNGLIGGLNDVISRLTPMLPGIVQDLGDKIIESAPVILDTGADLLTNLITGITTALPKLGEKAAELVPVVTDKLKEDVPKILQAGVDLLSDLISGILSEVPTLVTEAAGLVQTIIDSLLSTDNLAKILQAGLDLIGALANSLPVAIPALLDVIPGIIDSIIGAFLKTDWLKTGTQIFSGLGQAITNIISKLSEIIPKLVKTITSKENISKTIKAAADLVKALAKSLKDSLPEIITAVGEIIAAIITAFSEIDWLETGKEIFSAYGDALVSIFSEGLGIIDGLLGTNLQQWYDDITAFWYDAGAKLYEVLNAEKIQSTEAQVKAGDLKTDLVLASNNYMRQGLGSAEALEKAKNEILDTAEEIALFNQYLKDEVTEAEAAQRLETLRATNQIETGAAMTVSRPSGMPSNVPASAVNQTTYNITYTNGMTPYEQRKNTQQLKEYESLYSS